MTVNVKSVGNKEYYEKSFCWTVDLVLPQNRGGTIETFPEKADSQLFPRRCLETQSQQSPACWPRVWNENGSWAEAFLRRLT